MAVANPTFNPSEFELRKYTNKYLSPEQTAKVAEVETRVDSQMNFLAQLLGWNGSNYWGNLPSTVSQKRQLLSGSFGVYEGFIIPRVYSIKDWANIQDFESPRVAIAEVEQDSRIQSGQYAYLGDYKYQIQSLSLNSGRLFLNFGEVDDNFFTEINNNTQLKIDAIEARPAPFYRPTLGFAGDNSFVVKENSGSLALYPSYDSGALFPYLFPTLFTGGTYYFDKPVFISFTEAIAEDILPSYDSELERWVIQVPNLLEADSPGVMANLVWSYSDQTTPVDLTLAVKIESWYDPSDWNSVYTLNNFLGAWGNKGGTLPFNLAFDSLSIHGIDERNSLYLPIVEKDLFFNDLVDLVYAQRSVIDSGIPGKLPPGKLWWNETSGVLAVQVKQEEDCPFWVEVSYREAPEQELIPGYVFSNISAFDAGRYDVPEGVLCVLITDITGLSADQDVLGLEQPIPGSGFCYLYRVSDTDYWQPIRFVFSGVSGFDASSLQIPYGVPTYITNSVGLTPQGVNYTINNLDITVSGKYEVVLVKQNSESDWTLFPDSVLKYIAKSGLYNGPQQGEMWWDFANPNPATRSARIYKGMSWVALNTNVSASSPPASLDLDTVLIYCDGYLLTSGVNYLTDDFIFVYEKDTANGKYNFTYQALSLHGKINLPKITISDSLTSSYQLDISSELFSGVTFKLSPNVYDAEAPLRIWQSQALQVAETVNLIDQEIYPNPLVADQNSGPGPENWEKYFVRLPLDYERNGATWQKTALVCQDFAYYGSSVEPEDMNCPPEVRLPKIYEEIYLFNDRTDYTYVYLEPYLYSNIVYSDFPFEEVSYANGALRATRDYKYDEFDEAQIVDYEPLHNRQVDFSTETFGNWVGIYLNINACDFLSGYAINDIMAEALSPVEAPIWDASIYKCPPLCENVESTYAVDANNYKIGYAYFIADASAAEDGLFDPTQEASWRFPIDQPKTSYLVPA